MDIVFMKANIIYIQSSLTQKLFLLSFCLLVCKSIENTIRWARPPLPLFKLVSVASIDFLTCWLYLGG